MVRIVTRVNVEGGRGVSYKQQKSRTSNDHGGRECVVKSSRGIVITTGRIGVRACGESMPYIKNSHVTLCSTLEWDGHLLRYSELRVEEETRQEGKRDWKLRRVTRQAFPDQASRKTLQGGTRILEQALSHLLVLE